MKTKTKNFYDKSSKQLKDHDIGTGVMVKIHPEDNYRTLAIISNKLGNRSYEIVANNKKYICNRQHLNEYNHCLNASRKKKKV